MSVFRNLSLASGVLFVVFTLSEVSAQRNFELPHDIDLESMEEIEDLQFEKVHRMFEVKMASRDQQGSVSNHEDDDRGNNVAADPNPSCNCYGLQCSCCHTIQIYSFRQDGCLRIAYVPDRKVIRFSLTIGSSLLFSKESPVTRVPPICVRYPKISRRASVCVEFNSLRCSTTTFHGCSKLKVNALGITLLTVDLGCFDMTLPRNAVQDVDEMELPYLEGGKDSAKDPGPIYPW